MKKLALGLMICSPLLLLIGIAGCVAAVSSIGASSREMGLLPSFSLFAAPVSFLTGLVLSFVARRRVRRQAETIGALQRSGPAGQPAVASAPVAPGPERPILRVQPVPASPAATLTPLNGVSAGPPARNRRRRYGIGLILVGALTLLFFIGLPLLIIGIVLLVAGEDRGKHQKWIRVFFWGALFLVAVAFALPFVIPIDERLPGPDAAGVIQALFFGPLLLVFMIGVAMSTLTVASFRDLSWKYRLMGMCPIFVLAVLFAFIVLLI